MVTNEIRNAFSVLEEANEAKKAVIVFDTETTGLSSSEDTLIQVSAVKIDPDSLDITDELDIIINPLCPVSEKITEITGYTNDFLETQLPEEFVFPQIQKFFGDTPYVIGYNIDFDIRFMKAMYARYGKVFSPDGKIDVCKIARQTLRKGKDVGNHKLGTVASYYGVDADLKFHESQDDVKATLRIFIAMMPDEEPEQPKITPIVNGASYFNGYRGHSRIYFYSNEGSFYWDAFDKKFNSKEFNVSDADLDTAVSSICNKWHVNTIDELFKKMQNWWQKKQEERIGEERIFSPSDEKTMKSYLKKNHFFDYTAVPDDDGNITITFVKFVKSRNGKKVSV